MTTIKTTAILLALTSVVPAAAQQDGGKASYYANSLHGRKMSNGQPYDRNRLTCAHRTLPFGTRLRVTNPANGRQVVVEVTDRGPFVRGRIIDLSYAAARQLGTIAAGVGYVRIEVLKDGDTGYTTYASESHFQLPEMEEGMAGVCYEFIPEWKEEPREENAPALTADAPKEVETASGKAEAGNKDKPAIRQTASAVQQKPSTAAKTPQKPAPQPAGKPSTASSAKPAQQEKPQDKKGDSKSWTTFFDKLKTWGGNLFE